ncbi:MAG: glycosyltransferase [Bacteroidales bacterium]|nr:glycosyltransferase [Bacteroidales bacterium]
MKFSIITVTYNAEATIERTLKSVAQQTYAEVEHLIMDGASTDRTLEIASRYPHATVWSSPDNGLYDAMNHGISKATGDFICFLNAGDTLHEEDTLKHLAEAWENANKAGDVAVLYGDTHIVDAEGKFLRKRRLTPPEHLDWRSFQEGMLVCHQSFYINRHLALTYDLQYRFSADFDWCIRCMKEGEKRGFVNVYVREPLTDYLSEGMTTANHKASLQERFRIMAQHYGYAQTVLQHIWFMVRSIIKK